MSQRHSSSDEFIIIWWNLHNLPDNNVHIIFFLFIQFIHAEFISKVYQKMQHSSLSRYICGLLLIESVPSYVVCRLEFLWSFPIDSILQTQFS